MKRLTFSALAAALFCLPATAQRTGLWVTPTANIGGGTMLDIFPSTFDAKFSIVFGIGAEASYMFNNNIGVGTGFTYSGYGYVWNIKNGSNNMDYIGAQAYFDVPIYLRLVTGRSNGFFANMGLINGIFLSSQQSIEVNNRETTKVKGSESNPDFNKFSLSPFVYFGANIRCGSRVQMTLGPQISYQLNNNFSSSSGGDGHYLNIAIKVGVGIHAWRPKTKS